MKMSRIISLILVVVMIVSTLASCKGPDQGSGNQGGSHEYEEFNGTYDITMWVSEIEGVDKLFLQQIDAFEAKYPGIVINASIEGVTEADAGSMVIKDVFTAPDIYCFAQDQLARLVQAAAIAPVASGIATRIKANNDAGSVAAATVGETLYAYPLTSDNGFYMYYDTSIISEEDAESFEKLIEICEQNNKKFRFALNNAWYSAAFFFATGCHSKWTVDDNGNFTDFDDTYNSPEGLIAMRAMSKLAKSSCYESDNNIFNEAAVIITGTWAANDAEEYFGENLGATDLPSFEIDGESYHLCSFTGNKLMGVKPQVDEKRAAVLSLLAEFLTGQECQQQRFDSFTWGPSNVVVQANDAVKSDLHLNALALQSAYGQPQEQIPDGWWTLAAVLGDQAKDYPEEDMPAMLQAYYYSVEEFMAKLKAESN